MFQTKLSYFCCKILPLRNIILFILRLHSTNTAALHNEYKSGIRLESLLYQKWYLGILDEEGGPLSLVQDSPPWYKTLWELVPNNNCNRDNNAGYNIKLRERADKFITMVSGSSHFIVTSTDDDLFKPACFIFHVSQSKIQNFSIIIKDIAISTLEVQEETKKIVIMRHSTLSDPNPSWKANYNGSYLN